MLARPPHHAAWLLALACTAPAFAQTTVVVDLPAQPLVSALGQFGQQAGISVLAPQELVAGRMAPALSGRYAPRVALDALLAGSGLVATLEGGVATVRRPADGSRGAAELAPITVTGVARAEHLNTASVQRLTRAELDRFPAAGAADLLRDIAGVTVANSRNGIGLDVNIRGMQGFGRVKVLVDGTDSNSSSYKGYGGERTRAFVDPELLGDITVEKGPNAGPYGAGVVGGVVSMNTLSARDLIEEGRSYGLRVRGTLSNDGTDSSPYYALGPGSSGSADITTPAADATVREVGLPGRPWTGSVAGAWRPNDMLELVAGASRRRHGNYSSGSRGDVTGRYRPDAEVRRLSYYQPGSEVYNTSQETDSVLFKAGLRLPHAQRIDVGYSRLDSRFGEARSAGYQEYVEQLNLSSADKKLYTAKYAWSPEQSPWIDLRINLWAADTEEYQANDIRGIAMISGIHRAQHANTRGRGMEIWNTSTVDVLGMGLSLRYGATWLREKVRITPLDQGIYMEPNGRREIRSTFVQAELAPVESVRIDAGLRRDRYAMEGVGEIGTAIYGQILPLDIRHGEARTNPSLGASWQVTPAWQVFGRYSEGWRPPSAKETINGLVADANTTRTMLRPEFTRSTELGTSLALRDLWRAGDRFKAGFTFFRNRTSDYIYGFAGEFKNAGSADIRGAELSLDYDAGIVFGRYQLTRYTHISFCGVALAFASAPPCFDIPYLQSGWDLAMSGLYVPPKAQHSATVGVRLLARKLVLGLRASAARDHAVDGNAVPGGWRSYIVYDLFGSWRVNRNLDIRFSVENLRDRFYLEAGTSGMLAIPAPGRTAKMSLTYTF